MRLVVFDIEQCKLQAVWLLNLPCVCTYKSIACLCVIVSFKLLTIPGRISAVVYTDLSDKQPCRQVGMGCMVTSGSLGGEMLAHRPRMQEMWVRFHISRFHHTYKSRIKDMVRHRAFSGIELRSRLQVAKGNALNGFALRGHGRNG